jgi:hypothetical protein
VRHLLDEVARGLAHVFERLRPGGAFVLGITENAVGPDGGSAKRAFDEGLLPPLTAAGFRDLSAVGEPGGNGLELLIVGRRPPLTRDAGIR